MNEDTDTQTGGAGEHVVSDIPASDASPQVEAPQEPSADTTEQQTGTEDTGQADETGDAPKRKPWWEKRFDELTAQKYKAAEEAAYWRGIAEGGGHQQQTQQPQDGPPREDQFETWDDYQEALIDYKVEKRMNVERQRAQQTSVLHTYEERAASFRKNAPDFDDITTDPTLKISPVMAEVIRESEIGPQVAYHLGTNRSEAERIANLPPHRQAAELGKLEARLSQPVTPPTPKAPPPEPPKTISGIAAGINKAPEEMSMAEYMDWHRTRDN